MILKRKLCKYRALGLWETSPGERVVSVGWFEKLFNIPDDARYLWISVHEEPAAGREPMRVVMRSCVYPKYPALLPISQRLKDGLSHPSFDSKLMRYAGKTVYLEVWYDVPKGE